MEQASTIEVIKPEAVITIKLNRDFYVRLTIILQEIIAGKSNDEMIAAAKQIEDKNISEMWVFNYETMLYLIKACEDYCKENNLIEIRDLEQFKAESEQRQQEYLANFPSQDSAPQ